jgi:hypothetical protein
VTAAAAEETNIEVSDDDGDTEANDTEMADENGTPKKKAKEFNPRKPSINLNMEALTNEYAALAVLEPN